MIPDTKSYEAGFKSECFIIILISSSIAFIVCSLYLKFSKNEKFIRTINQLSLNGKEIINSYIDDLQCIETFIKKIQKKFSNKQVYESVAVEDGLLSPIIPKTNSIYNNNNYKKCLEKKKNGSFSEVAIYLTLPNGQTLDYMPRYPWYWDGVDLFTGIVPTPMKYNTDYLSPDYIPKRTSIISNDKYPDNKKNEVKNNTLEEDNVMSTLLLTKKTDLTKKSLKDNEIEAVSSNNNLTKNSDTYEIKNQNNKNENIISLIDINDSNEDESLSLENNINQIAFINSNINEYTNKSYRDNNSVDSDLSSQIKEVNKLDVNISFMEDVNEVYQNLESNDSEVTTNNCISLDKSVLKDNFQIEAQSKELNEVLSDNSKKEVASYSNNIPSLIPKTSNISNTIKNENVIENTNTNDSIKTNSISIKNIPKSPSSHTYCQNNKSHNNKNSLIEINTNSKITKKSHKNLNTLKPIKSKTKKISNKSKQPKIIYPTIPINPNLNFVPLYQSQPEKSIQPRVNYREMEITYKEMKLKLKKKKFK